MLRVARIAELAAAREKALVELGVRTEELALTQEQVQALQDEVYPLSP